MDTLSNSFLTNEERFRLIAISSPAIVWMTDADGKCSFVNQTWLDFTGFSLEDALNYKWTKLVHPDDKSIFSSYYSALDLHNTITVEYRLKHKDGSWRWLLDRAIPVFNSENIFCGYMGYAIDITERKQIDIANQYYASIIKSSDDAIISKDTNGIVTGWNPAAERIFGYTEDEMIGTSMLKLFPPDNKNEEVFIMEKILRGIAIKHFETVRIHKNGSQIDISISLSPILNSNGKVIGASKIARDITEKKLNEKRLAEAKDAAEAGVRMKSAFIANMSHEIRTPMNAILGFSEIVLQDPSLSSASLKNMKTIYSASKSLLEIINDVLDVSKMESGKFALESVCFNLYNVLKESIRTFKNKAMQKNLCLDFEYDKNLPIRVIGDPTKLRQVILNLVGNSIKFTESGSIKLVVKLSDKEGMLHFSVTDTGIGMTEEQVGLVFKPFSQADISTTRRFGGTGLGTSISKQIVEMMGGKIWIESSFGKGSTFHFTANFPIAANIEGCLYEDSCIDSNDYVAPRLFNILLAEDIEVNATLATFRLEQQGHSVHWVKNGQEAVAAFENGQYDLILMDVQMPELDGLSATREIRKLETNKNKDEKITILALTASVLHEDNHKAIEAGMNAVVFKPIEFAKLFSIMENTISPKKGRLKTTERIPLAKTFTTDFSALNNVVDYEKGLKIWRDQSLYMKALGSFIKEHSDDTDKLIESTDKHQMRQMSHALKGVASNLAILHIPVVAGEIEALCIENNDEKLNTLFSQLQELFTRLKECFNLLQFQEENEATLKTFNTEDVCQLLAKLLNVLKELNPYVIEPVLLDLGEYLLESDLIRIKQAVDNFDFDEAINQTHLLIQRLNLTIGDGL